MSDGVKAAFISGVFAVIVALLTVFSKPITESFFPDRSDAARGLTALDDAGSVAPTGGATSEEDPPPAPRKATAAGKRAATSKPAATSEPADPSPAESRGPRLPSAPLAGAEGYYFLVSYHINGAPQPLRGSMSVTRASEDRFELTSNVGRSDVFAAPVPYYGVISRRGGTWYVELASPVDPSAAATGPVANDISYADDVLTFRSAYGHVVVWRKK
jgi:hypothetical protein